VDYFNPTTPSPPVVTAKVMTGAPVTTSGVKVGAPMDLTGLYTVPVKITNTTRSKVRTPLALTLHFRLLEPFVEVNIRLGCFNGCVLVARNQRHPPNLCVSQATAAP
jgi:hypothetical protein